MSLLRESDREILRKEFEKLQDPVKLVFFSQALDCDYCPLTKEVLEELSGLSDKMNLVTYNFAIDQDQVYEYKIQRIPALALVRVETTLVDGGTVTRERDYGIRYYGVPSGYEFGSLAGDIIDISRGESGLSAESKSALARLKDPLHLQVFVTPT